MKTSKFFCLTLLACFLIFSTLLGQEVSLKVDSTGNVGIGTSTPSSSLQFNPPLLNIKANNGPAAIVLEAPSVSGGVIEVPGDSPFRVYTNNYERMRVLGNGNVGVGTSSPDSKLEVNGIIYSTGEGYKFPDGTVQTTAASGGGADSDWNISGNNMYSAVSGNVGIGTPTPKSFLDNNTPVLHIKSTNGRAGIVLEAPSVSGGAIEVPGNSPLRVFTNNAERIRVIGNGNVGIGTYSPNSKLEVNGTIYSTSEGFKFPDGSVQTTAASGGGADSDWNISGNNMYSAVSGNVGIGTPTPKSFLDNNTPVLHIKSTNGRAGIVLEAPTVSGGAIEVPGDAPLRVFTNNTERIRVKGNGYVGIGTSSPSYPLHMSGGAYCTGTTWVNASSKAYKENIRNLSIKEAKQALKQLSPKKYNYKIDTKEECLGFIAEEVPELVSTQNRKGLSPMDIIAVLTKVVQEQQRKIEDLEKKIK
jgi:hypothetical protein